jgi:hypothetical protein
MGTYPRSAAQEANSTRAAWLARSARPCWTLRGERALPDGDPASRQTGQAGPHNGLSPAPHKISADNPGRHRRRSGRVRRQGLEPRTRGLRVRCSAN